MSENGSRAKFDFSRVSRKWNQQFLKTLAKASRAQFTLERKPPEDAKEAEKLLGEKVQALDDLEALGDEQAALLAQVLVDVPDEWLLEGAPENLDWSKPESLDWIQSERYSEIFIQLRNRNAAEAEAKN